MNRSAGSPAPNLVLVGFMATGKSTIGRRCARELGYPFRDSDSVIERRAGKSIPAIFAEDGEPAFRRLEAAAIRELARAGATVIATGGGAPMNSGNVAYLRRTGFVVLLWSDPEEILARCGTRANRPLLAGANDPRARIECLLAQREPAYRAAAHAVVDSTGLTREETAQRVLDAYRAHVAGLERRPA